MTPASRLTTATVAARIPYANAAPFYALWSDAPFAVRNLVPRELGREAESGGVDLGLMATGDFLRLGDRFELLTPPMGVATRGAVQSVLLFSRRPASALEGALISVTPETSTSIRLLRLLLDTRRGFAGVRYVRGLEPSQADALLMIGDRAMRMRQKRPEGFTHTLDLGADWLEWTGLPFVYAVWTVRRALEAQVKADLGQFLEGSLAAGLADLPAVARQQTEPGWTPEETEAYLRRFHYRLGPEDLRGMERFEQLLREHPDADAG
ncbi:MAG: menaquinone biosynthesis protein [Candidatus Eisenbacteria bacterium]|uniref:Chorismate dehydratase n=1 Tax=Eiseniibacteriota bacterium TaxID=2212470 RepID=A0A9D6L9F3_UNCEI|nr:menaquinone biosynthesis protein [Candidatus Eisenbacteria bacterium]MBI3540060.1 menaquinone biosynthesis protein [Candidatus Eisenbacteria bacterium]